MIMKKVNYLACSDDCDHQSYNFTMSKMVVAKYAHAFSQNTGQFAYSGYQRVNNKNILNLRYDYVQPFLQ